LGFEKYRREIWPGRYLMTEISIVFEHVPEHYVPSGTITVVIHRRPSQDYEARDLESVFYEAWRKHLEVQP
jgi:hypothetical protein